MAAACALRGCRALPAAAAAALAPRAPPAHAPAHTHAAPAAAAASHPQPRSPRRRRCASALHAVRKGAPPPPPTTGGSSDAGGSSSSGGSAGGAAAAALDDASAAEWVAFAEKDAPELDLLERDPPAPPGAVPPEFSAAVNLMCNRTLKARSHAHTHPFIHTRTPNPAADDSARRHLPALSLSLQAMLDEDAGAVRALSAELASLEAHFASADPPTARFLRVLLAMLSHAEPSLPDMARLRPDYAASFERIFALIGDAGWAVRARARVIACAARRCGLRLRHACVPFGVCACLGGRGADGSACACMRACVRVCSLRRRSRV
jgi:hypothetical protein